MSAEMDITQGKSLDEMGSEIVWFGLHSLFAVLTFGAMLAGSLFLQPDPNASTPKLVMTGLAFLGPAVIGFLLARVKEGVAASKVWLAGLIFFGILCVWVLDLPTGTGLCGSCTASEKLWRTFFDVSHGSGLLNGNGLLFGTWIPLSMIGYGVGAQLSISPTEQE